MAEASPIVGQTVQTQDGRLGVVRYTGTLEIAAGEWLGLELPDSSGKNDGSVKGVRYFSCQPGYGIFVRKESVVKIVKSSEPPASQRASNNTTRSVASDGPRSRQSTGISADVARKRQSLMGTGPGSAVGSRLSTRSPTKSPSKPVRSVATSAASTPRTGTPTGTTRTSDSSTKSRLSVSGKPLMPPPSLTSRNSIHTSRPSIGGAPARSTKPVSGAARPSIGASRLSSASNAVSAKPRRPASQTLSHGKVPTSAIEEANTDGESAREVEEADEGQEEQVETISEEAKQPVSPGVTSVRKTSISRTTGASNVEVRTAQQREVEELKAKLRTIERKRQEDAERLSRVDTLQNDRDRFENIIQALQKKLKANQQEMTDLRTKLEEADQKVRAVPDNSAEHESEMELATIDKELAEERAENYHTELQILKSKHEELELEVEILKEENRELGSVLSPEEKASAGWLQMERERERLREALFMLRDMSQQIETDLRSEIKELKDSLDEAETTAGMYNTTAESLAKAEATNRHLMEQLEAADTNDEVIEAMEAQREQQVSSIEQLKRQIQDLEEHIQVTDELEAFHVEEEKRLHSQLDDTEALLNEGSRRNVEQDRVIEDLEYTLTKFRDVVQGLQGDIDELRRSRDISEVEATEMSSKSRAMMDLNLRLQSNAAKSQTKIIDAELDKVRADLANKHVEVLQLFTHENFDSERNSILAFLCFSRIRAKAGLVSRLLGDRLRERTYLSSGEELYNTFNVMERMQWIAGACERFETFMSSCDAASFAKCGSALREVDPVERATSLWLDALRRDELSSDGPEYLKRMQGILIDLLDKIIPENTETKATEMITQMGMIENHADSLASQLNTLVRIVQTKLGDPRDSDEDSLEFDKKMNLLSTKARTVKYLSSKTVRELNELRKDSICLNETNWVLFDDAEHQADALAQSVRQLGLSVSDIVSELEPEEPLSYHVVISKMASAWYESQPQRHDSQNGTTYDSDVFTNVTGSIASLQSTVDDLTSKVNDTASATKFEVGPPPWIVRARELKAEKVISPEVQEDLTRLQRRNLELSSHVAEREKAIEEMTLRVEVAEKRMKDSRARDDKDKAIKDEAEALRTELESATKLLEEVQVQLADQLQTSQQDRLELESLRKTTASDSLPSFGTLGVVDERMTADLQARNDLLQSEIINLQAAVRFLREDNRSLRVPVTETLINAASNSWLGSSLLSRQTNSSRVQMVPKDRLERETTNLLSNLIDIATTLEPVSLARHKLPQTAPAGQSVTSTAAAINQSSWQPLRQTTRYTVLKQREKLERWESWRTDLTKRAKVFQRRPLSDIGTSSHNMNSSDRTRSGISAATVSSKNKGTTSVVPVNDGSNLTAPSNDEISASRVKTGPNKPHLDPDRGDNVKIVLDV